jgi:hypothetical protein
MKFGSRCRNKKLSCELNFEACWFVKAIALYEARIELWGFLTNAALFTNAVNVIIQIIRRQRTTVYI